MSDDLRLRGSLIGRAATRDRLNTPVLVVDREALDRNIARMREQAARHLQGSDVGRFAIGAGGLVGRPGGPHAACALPHRATAQSPL